MDSVPKKIPLWPFALAALAAGDLLAQAPVSTGLPRTYAPTRARGTEAIYPWRRDITATVFWVGEKASANNPTHNRASSWDTKWMHNFGGTDHPDRDKRATDYRPKEFVPKLNPFYVALPYNDRIDHARTKPSARRVIPWFRRSFEREGKSVCDGRWVAIHHRGKTCFAQWSDVGPFETDDWAYVFGTARPKNPKNKGAGIDISPAVRDYLGIDGGMAKVHWRFVEFREIPTGPWAKFGENNHFIHYAKLRERAEREEIERLKRARDEWVRRNTR